MTEKQELALDIGTLLRSTLTGEYFIVLSYEMYERYDVKKTDRQYTIKCMKDGRIGYPVSSSIRRYYECFSKVKHNHA
jgi:hypothetical protein